MDINEDTIDTDNVQPAQDDNVSIGVEQICAAILAELGSVEIPLNTLISDFSNKLIAVNQNEETKALSFSLIDKDSAEQAQAENQ